MGLKIEKVEAGRPLGETLMCEPCRGAEAVKKMGCWWAWGVEMLAEGVMGEEKAGGTGRGEGRDERGRKERKRKGRTHC